MQLPSDFVGPGDEEPRAAVVGEAEGTAAAQHFAGPRGGAGGKGKEGWRSSVFAAEMEISWCFHGDLMEFHGDWVEINGGLMECDGHLVEFNGSWMLI